MPKLKFIITYGNVIHVHILHMKKYITGKKEKTVQVRIMLFRMKLNNM